MSFMVFSRKLPQLLRHKNLIHKTINVRNQILIRHLCSTTAKFVDKESTTATKIQQIPNLKDFLALNQKQDLENVDVTPAHVPYLDPELHGCGRKVYFETYGCQMNVNDMEVVWSILQNSGFDKCDTVQEANVVLIMTCAIREGAESKIWKRLEFMRSIRRKRSKYIPFSVGVLGCMAERLKTKLLEAEKGVDLVAGPDSYRDLPRLLSVVKSGKNAANVQLSLEETYADVTPVRLNLNSVTAFVSIMRGCDNMCSYCIVPFTRGRERSRPMSSILDEIRHLSQQGIKEVTLLGQNVNSYIDKSMPSAESEATQNSEGFKTIYKSKVGGRRFADLVDQVSLIDPEMRIRFTSPHPKDFPDDLLHLIRDRPNVCKYIHLPAQSGSTKTLEKMRRGYSREAYLNLVEKIRSIIPGVTFSSDIIAGFCSESEEDHKETLSLMESVKFDLAFMFAYSLREKTHAHRRYEDDVPEDVKLRRLQEVIEVYRRNVEEVNKKYISTRQLVLVEGNSKRSDGQLVGRSDGFIKVIFDKKPLFCKITGEDNVNIKPGDYVEVDITFSSKATLKGTPIAKTSLQKFYANESDESNELKKVVMV